jgi:hypothetical protein
VRLEGSSLLGEDTLLAWLSRTMTANLTAIG